MNVLMLLLITGIIADNRLRGGCYVKDTEAPWVVYIRNCALSNENSAASTETTPEPRTRPTYWTQTDSRNKRGYKPDGIYKHYYCN